MVHADATQRPGTPSVHALTSDWQEAVLTPRWAEVPQKRRVPLQRQEKTHNVLTYRAL